MTDPERIIVPRLREVEACEDFPDRLGESPQEARERLGKARETRTRLWDASVPLRFRTASLDALSPAQDLQGRVSRWWSSTALTLVLRSAESGVGKSHAAYAVGNDAVRHHGAWGAAWTMVALNDAIRPGNDPTAYHVAQECDLLLIDDLGRERSTEWTLERLQGILDSRWSNQKRTIITTQVPGEEIVSRYGDPIIDRIGDNALIVEVTGKSRRRPAPW